MPRRARTTLVALTCLLSLSLAGAASADPRQELHQAFTRTQALKSFKATMHDISTDRTVSVVEFQAPDRYRVSAGGQPPSLIIGDAMYMNAGGRQMKVPLPKGSFGKFRNEEAMAELGKGATVEGLGAGLVGKEPARKYRFRSASGQQQSTSLVWVGVRSGNVLQVETSGKQGGKPFAMRVSYSDFNSPAIRIAAPD